MKFWSIHESLAAQFPATKFSTKVVSDIVNSAFPSSTRTLVGKAKASHVVGIEEVVMNEEQQCNELERQKAVNAKLIEHTRVLEANIHELEKRVHQLEQQETIQNVTQQMHCLMNPSHVAFHGPDTIEHLQNFSLDSIVAKFKQCCPDILKIFQSIGKSSDHDPSRESKLCILMKSYSQKVLGIQLMTTC